MCGSRRCHSDPRGALSWILPAIVIILTRDVASQYLLRKVSYSCSNWGPDEFTMAGSCDNRVIGLIGEISRERRLQGEPPGEPIIECARFKPQLSPIFKNALDVSFTMQHRENLKRGGFVPVNNRVVRIAPERPETDGPCCKIRPTMTA